MAFFIILSTSSIILQCANYNYYVCKKVVIMMIPTRSKLGSNINMIFSLRNKKIVNISKINDYEDIKLLSEISELDLFCVLFLIIMFLVSILLSQIYSLSGIYVDISLFLKWLFYLLTCRYFENKKIYIDSIFLFYKKRNKTPY